MKGRGERKREAPYSLAIGGGVRDDLAKGGEEVGGDDIIALVLVDDSKVADGGTEGAVLAPPELRHHQLALLHGRHGGLEEGGRVAVGKLAEDVELVTERGAVDAHPLDEGVGRPGAGQQGEGRGVRAEPQPDHVVDWEGGRRGLDPG